MKKGIFMENKKITDEDLIKNLSFSKENQKKHEKWINNQGDEVKNVFGFNASAELVNGRAAMVGFIMLILTELVFQGRPVTSAIFGIN